MMDKQLKIKPVFWIGSSKKDLKEFPQTVQDGIGYSLHLAQTGDMPFKSMKNEKESGHE